MIPKTMVALRLSLLKAKLFGMKVSFGKLYFQLLPDYGTN